MILTSIFLDSLILFCFTKTKDKFDKINFFWFKISSVSFSLGISSIFEIIRQLDKKFAKSYARLINTYLDENKIACARYHYNLMKTNCKNDMNKFPELIEKMEKKIEENDSETNNLKMLMNLFKK